MNGWMDKWSLFTIAVESINHILPLNFTSISWALAQGINRSEEWSFFQVISLGNEAQKKFFHTFASNRRDSRRSTERRWSLCSGPFAGRLMVPDLEDRKLGHTHGKVTAAQQANGIGSAGNLWGCEETVIPPAATTFRTGKWRLQKRLAEI